jgi:predicted Abi (CAAX) family protease
LRCWPDRRGWRRVLVELGWALPLLLVVAHLGGLLRLVAPPDASTFLALAATLLLAPALGEELLFRGLLIPRHGPGAAWVLLSVGLFVLWHPLQALSVGPPWSAAFLDPWFLAAVAILGTALARIYAATGSLWPGVLVHWIVVLGWKAWLGGPF